MTTDDFPWFAPQVTAWVTVELDDGQRVVVIPLPARPVPADTEGGTRAVVAVLRGAADELETLWTLREMLGEAS